MEERAGGARRRDDEERRLDQGRCELGASLALGPQRRVLEDGLDEVDANEGAAEPAKRTTRVAVAEPPERGEGERSERDLHAQRALREGEHVLDRRRTSGGRLRATRAGRPAAQTKAALRRLRRSAPISARAMAAAVREVAAHRAEPTAQRRVVGRRERRERVERRPRLVGRHPSAREVGRRERSREVEKLFYPRIVERIERAGGDREIAGEREGAVVAEEPGDAEPLGRRRRLARGAVTESTEDVAGARLDARGGDGELGVARASRRPGRPGSRSLRHRDGERGRRPRPRARARTSTPLRRARFRRPRRRARGD